MQEDNYVLKMEHITKRFPGTMALDDVNFYLKRREIHALVGENGAGKSTLIKVLGGIYKPDTGEITLNGGKVNMEDPKMARNLGISIVFQEFNLIPDLTVVENLFLSMEKVAGKYFLKRKKMYSDSEQVLKKVGLDVDPEMKVSELAVAEQQLVEIAKALLAEARILILDEPTAVLSKEEVKRLFQIMRDLKNEDKSLIFVSHRLDEILEIADVITVLKDGKNVKTLANEGVKKDDLIRLMVGKDFKNTFVQKKEKPRDEVLMEVQNLNVENKVVDVSFEIKVGEIVALGGLEGHGQKTIIEALFGLHRYDGSILLRGKPVRINSPKHALKQGIIMITDDRKEEGLCLDLSVLYNLETLGFDRFSTRIGIIKSSLEEYLAWDIVRDMKIRTPSLFQKVKFLSGGNQQRVLVGRINFLPQVNVLLFKELTRGIDVGAKIQLYHYFHGIARKRGLGILFYSSDLLEVLGLADRIIGIYDGRITTVIENKDLNEEKLMSKILQKTRG